MALTEAQKQLIAKNKREAADRRAASALRRQAPELTRSSSKQMCPPAYDTTLKERQRMEENYRRALETALALCRQVSKPTHSSSKQTTPPTSNFREEQRRKRRKIAV